MIFDLSSATTDELLERYEAVRFEKTAERKALQNEIAWRVHVGYESGQPVVRGNTQYTLDINDELCRVTVESSWVRAVQQCDVGLTWFEQLKAKRAKIRKQERKQQKQKVAS